MRKNKILIGNKRKWISDIFNLSNLTDDYNMLLLKIDWKIVIKNQLKADLVAYLLEKGLLEEEKGNIILKSKTIFNSLK